jgi:hypothetical protein
MGYSEGNFIHLRSLIADYLKGNMEIFNEIAFEDEYQISRETYIAEIETGRRWGSALEILCAVNILNISVNVFLRYGKSKFCS